MKKLTYDESLEKMIHAGLVLESIRDNNTKFLAHDQADFNHILKLLDTFIRAEAEKANQIK
jgi:hypothetical protein